MKITGKRVLITGGTQGIGLACAKAMARDGAHVTVVARTEGDLPRGVEWVRRSR